MKLFKYILLSAALITSTATFGQLLERENVQSRIAAGTRPQQGNFGFMIGPSITELSEFIDDNQDIQGFPLMSFKYYLKDQIELRLSTQIYGTTEKYQGTLTNEIGREDNVEKESFVRFMPSAHYHFASSNFLDTYAGIGIIIGSEKDEVLTTDKTTLSGDYFAEHLTKKTFAWGFNVNFGMQAFIADLPLSIAAEVSIRSLKHSKLQYENETQSSVGGVVTNQTFFQLDDSAGALRFESLEYEEHEIGADLRFLISYYFRK